MRAIAVTPGKKGSVREINVEKPVIDEVPCGRGVLVRVTRVGLDGTDREIIEGAYGAAPEGEEFLILGHESLGIVEEVGENVTEFKPGDPVTVTVRRPGTSIYDKIGMYDFTIDDLYYERGINLLHGYLTEYFIESPDYLVGVPKGLGEIGVLSEPTSIVEKGVHQAYKIQERLKVWYPSKAAVLGAGSLGLLAALILCLRGLNVSVFARTEPPNLKSHLVEELSGRYVSTKQMSLGEASKKYGPYDIIFEATGYSPIAFESMKVLAKNGVLILSSVTVGDRTAEIEADKINLGFVQGNKVCFGTINSNRCHFELGVKDLSQALLQYPGWLNKLLTHPIDGLDAKRIDELLKAQIKDVIKVFCKISHMPGGSDFF